MSEKQKNNKNASKIIQPNVKHKRIKESLPIQYSSQSELLVYLTKMGRTRKSSVSEADAELVRSRPFIFLQSYSRTIVKRQNSNLQVSNALNRD